MISCSASFQGKAMRETCCIIASNCKVCSTIACHVRGNDFGADAQICAGPEGSKTLSYAGSTIAHTVADLLSKNLWGFVANYLRLCIHKHIIMYGDLRKKIKVNVAGQEVEVEQFQEEPDEETVKHSTEPLAHRHSFIAIRNQLQNRVRFGGCPCCSPQSPCSLAAAS
jgi:hypothetical protein